MLRERRWKPIPVIYPEQEIALEFLSGERLVRPCLKTLQKYAGNSKIGLYGGRKGFTDLMLSLGQKIEDISIWMGHTSIEVTWRYYKNKRAVSFTQPFKKKETTTEAPYVLH
jgi:integrase